MEATNLTFLTDQQLLVLCPLLACVLLFVTTFIFRKFRTQLGLSDYDGDVLDTATQNTMSGAYVVLGFVLVLAMTTVSDLDNNVSQEAAAIKSLERTLILEGSKPALEARDRLVAYTKSVLQDEWPLLVGAHGSPQTAEKLRELFNGLDNINPITPKDAVVYAKILELADKVAELRTSRNFSIDNNLPWTFYIVGLFSVFGVIIICAMRLIEATRVRILALTTQLVMLTLMLSAIIIVDLPYVGDTVTSLEPIQKVYDTMQPGKSTPK